MRVASTPALNKDGFAKVTLTEIKTDFRKNKETGEPLIDEKTGELKDYTQLVFSVMDTTRKVPIRAGVFMPDLNTPKADAILKGLGYTPAQLTTDEDGFAVVETDLGEDGFEVADEAGEQLVQVTTFLQSKIGSVYLAKVQRDGDYRWAIDTASLAPFPSKSTT